MKRLLQYVLNRLGYEIHRREYTGPPLDVLSLAARDRLRRLNELFVLQIGANDGISGDPVGEIICTNRLPALLVEPLPEAFSRLQYNYAGQQQVRLENCAVSGNDGVEQLWRVVGTAVPMWASQWASFERRVIEHNCRKLQCAYQIEALNVPTLTIRSLLNKHGVESVGLLQIDTEGYDDQILRLVFEAGLMPPIISYEYAHLPTDRRNHAIKLLAQKGYATCHTGRDVVGVLADPGKGSGRKNVGEVGSMS